MVYLLAAAMTITLIAAYVIPSDDHHNRDIGPFGWSISIAITIGIAFLLKSLEGWLTDGKKKREKGKLLRREAIALVGLSWFVGTIVAALPYLFCGLGITPTNAIFESISGLTTTGATVFTDIEGLPKSVLLWRSLTQWVGGMGILAMFVVILPGMAASSKALIGAESSLASSDVASIRQTMRRIWILYSGFTFICGIGLYFMGLTAFEAINHALTALSTGGFSTENASVGGAEPFHAGSKVWLAVFMLIGGITFPFHIAVLRVHRWKDFRASRYEEVFVFLSVVVVTTGILALQKTLVGGKIAVVDLFFNIVSVITSSGYTSSDFTQWSDLGVFTLLVLMITGGCGGSTAGGLKIGRIMLWGRVIHSNLVRTYRPQYVDSLRLNGQTVSDDTRNSLFLVISCFILFSLGGTALFLALQPEVSFFGAFSAVISCLSNIGPALSDMHPADAFRNLHWPTKYLCIVLMALGRLEYVAVLVLFTRQLWKKY